MTIPTKVDEDIAQGIHRLRIQPGGAAGPDNCVIDSDDLGGGMWSDSWLVGSAEDPWYMFNTEVRMAPNQYFPAHWHGAWISVIVWDGTILFGDWWMKPGDILISPANTEYGPLLPGPKGCQLFEVFGTNIGWEAAFAPEYHDQPTIGFYYNRGGGQPIFRERPPGSEHNRGHQITPLKSIPGFVTGSFDGSGRWDLGDAGDPRARPDLRDEDRALAVDRCARPPRLARPDGLGWHLYDGRPAAGEG